MEFLSQQHKVSEPSIMVIFGGTGDLTHRKLVPALYNLAFDQLMPDHFAIVSIGRRSKTSDEYRDELKVSLEKYSRNKISENQWERLRNIIYYYQLDFTESEGYESLATFLKRLDEQHQTLGNRVFYLAVAPEYFETIVNGLGKSGQASCHYATGENCPNWQRLVIEKPFGKDLQTAKHLNDCLHAYFAENDIYRIDHYLGKDMIQNIMVLRFANLVFESLWSNQYIDNVQISLGEKLGVGSRGGYYEHSGAIRDMVQNHILQILSMVAMEPPVALTTEAIRQEKLKVIQAITPFTNDSLRDNVVFGQYGSGTIDGEKVPAYREEPNVPENSTTETFVAMKLSVNNFRWAGTPFYIRTGKRLAGSSAEIVVQFKSLPNILYFADDKNHQEPNLLVIRIQPNVGVYFQVNTKDFSTQKDIMPVKVETSHLSPNQGNTPEAYERLIYDIMRGDATLFAWWNEVEASWKLADQIIAFRENQRHRFPNYIAGSNGPVKSIELLARDGREWWSV